MGVRRVSSVLQRKEKNTAQSICKVILGKTAGEYRL